MSSIARMTLIFSLLLSGCATTGQFDNRVVRTVNCDAAWFISLYKFIALVTPIDPRDMPAVCPEPKKD